MPALGQSEHSQSEHSQIDRPLVAVTGSSGLIGSRLVAALSEDYRVVGLDQKPPAQASGQPPAGTEWIECDLTRQESVQKALHALAASHGDRLASVVHLAAYYNFSGEPSPLYEELTVEGTRRLLQALRRFAVEQFIFSSSLLVMRPVGRDELLTEASPTEAAWDYPRSKLAAEQVIADEAGDMRAVVLRIAGVYDEDCHSIPIAQQIRRIYEKQFESYFFPGNAQHGQAFIHLADLIACFKRVIERRGQLPRRELLLIAEPDVMSYAELQEEMGQQLHGQEWPTIRVPKFVAKAGAWVQEKLAAEGEEPFIRPWMVDLADAHYAVDIRRSRTLLGWEPPHRLRTTLPAMLASLQADPERWYEVNGLSHEANQSKASDS
jgi:nucleoside-diphosphate-sugar epimerase